MAVFLSVLVSSVALVVACRPAADHQRPSTHMADPPSSSAPTTDTTFGATRRGPFEGLHYAPGSESQTLDLFLPRTHQPPFPVIVYVHGGGYVGGDKTSMLPRLGPYADQHGYALAAVDYRLLSESPFPAQAADVKAAIRWLRANSASYDLDERRFAVWGVSAGGHLAALAGTTGNSRLFDDPSLGNPDVSSQVAAVVDWMGPSDFVTLERYLESRRIGGWRPQMLDDIADQIDDSLELAHEAAPAHAADLGDPPFLIEHGSRDRIVPPNQSRQLARDLAGKIGEDKVTLVVLPRMGHNRSAMANSENMQFVFDWLDFRLRR